MRGDGRGEPDETDRTSSSIRQVKAEIRVLALAWFARDEESVEFVGVISRGGLWLDGLLITRTQRRPGVLEDELSRAVRASPHYGQVRAIIVPPSSLGVKLPLDPDRLAQKTGLPVILLASTPGRLSSFGLSREVAAKVVAQSCTFSRRPEPLRVAAVLAHALRGLGAAKLLHTPHKA
ncbi:MAG: hypothetical protein QW587_09925 [Candidatus Bathyarchaeia archaeon]